VLVVNLEILVCASAYTASLLLIFTDSQISKLVSWVKEFVARVNQPTSSRTSSTGREARRYIHTWVLMVPPRTLMRMLMLGARVDMQAARLDITLGRLSFAVPAIPPRIQLLMTMD